MLRLLLEIASLHISGHARQLYDEAIYFWRHLHLTSQPRSFCQTKRQVKHVVLIILWLGYLVINVGILNDYMACRASAGSATGTYSRLISLCRIYGAAWPYLPSQDHSPALCQEDCLL